MEVSNTFVNSCLLDMAKQISVAIFPYDGNGRRILPNGIRLKTEEYWDTILKEEERENFQRQAYAAWMVLSRYGVDAMMQAAFNQYISEK